jgi:transposase
MFERKNMRFVPIKTDDQLDLQAIHRVRDRLISRRTAVINQLRAFLLERSMGFAQKPAKLKAAMADILENAEADLTPLMRNLLNTLWGEWKLVEQQIEELNDELERISGGKAKLLGIIERGNVYLRKILIHGARAAVLRIKRDRALIRAWLDTLDHRAPKNVVVVAMANKLARSGPCSPAATSTDLSPHNGAEKTPAAWKRKALPLSHTKTTKVSPPKSAQEQ